MFWRRKDSDADDEPPTSVGDEQAVLARVRIFTIDSVVDGWVQLVGQRLSDVLNVEDLLSVSRIPTAPTESHWFVIERTEMLLVVPPPHVTDRAARLHRVKRHIKVVTGPYEVDGVVHMLAGIALDPFLARSAQHFLPLTEARVTSTKRPEIAQHHSALLVNVRSTSQPLKLDVLG